MNRNLLRFGLLCLVLLVSVVTKASDITLTYSLGTTTAEGTLPASATVEVGSSYTLPVNTTLYVAGSTLTGWTDGTNTYKPGETITAPSTSATLTPVFTANTKSLADRTEATTLTYYFGHKMVPRISTLRKGWYLGNSGDC